MSPDDIEQINSHAFNHEMIVEKANEIIDVVALRPITDLIASRTLMETFVSSMKDVPDHHSLLVPAWLLRDFLLFQSKTAQEVQRMVRIRIDN